MPAAAAPRAAARWRPERRPTGRRPDGLLQRPGRTLPDRARDEAAELAEYRRRLVPTAHGRVLEIGIGSGLNLPFYGAAVEHIFGLDPSSQLLAMAERRVRRMHGKVTLIEGAAEAIPLEDGAVDTVVMTWTLCSVAAVRRAMRDPARAESRRRPPVYRARCVTGSGCREMAGQADAVLEAYFRGLSPQPRCGPTPYLRRLQCTRVATRLYAGPAPVYVHVGGPRPAAVIASQ